MLNHPQRALPLQGARNFRDLGGYPGHGGRRVRWRKLFRSAHLGELTDADRALLAPLGLTRSFDFRGQDERAQTPYRLDGLTQHSLAIEPTVVQRMQSLAATGHALTADTVSALMQDLYRALINDHARRFAELFEHLLQADTPALLHCTAGKDRTGVAAALILLALGVPRDVVLEDFLLTNQLLQPPTNGRAHAHGLGHGTEFSAEAMGVLWSVQENFLRTALDVVDNEHGGVPRYLNRRLGLSASALDTLAARYLEPAT
jgi:protein-tyrosine phosphatase